MIKLVRFLEKMWLMLAIVTFILGVYKVFYSTKGDAAYFFVFAGVSIVIFYLRRRQRILYERDEKRRAADEEH